MTQSLTHKLSPLWNKLLNYLNDKLGRNDEYENLAELLHELSKLSK